MDLPPEPEALTTASARTRPACPADAPRHLLTKNGWRQHRAVLLWRLLHETHEEFCARRRCENEKLKKRPRRKSPQLDMKKSLEAYRKRLLVTPDAVFKALPGRIALSCYEGVRKALPTLEAAHDAGAPQHALMLWEELLRRGCRVVGLLPHTSRTAAGVGMQFKVPTPPGASRMYLGHKMAMDKRIPHPLAFGNHDKCYKPAVRTRTRPCKRRRPAAPEDTAAARDVRPESAGEAHPFRLQMLLVGEDDGRAGAWLTEDECDDTVDPPPAVSLRRRSRSS